MRSTNRTFASTAKIAEAAGVPATTAKKHIATLNKACWIQNLGRERLSGGALRRTASLALTNRTASVEQFGVLPCFCVQSEINGERLDWCSRAVFSVVCAQMRSLRKIDGVDSLSDLTDYTERFCFSVRWLHEITGLGHDAIVKAKRQLGRVGLVVWYGSINGGDRTGHQLFPSLSMRVLESATTPKTYTLLAREYHAA
jgi:hypothetical protein